MCNDKLEYKVVMWMFWGYFMKREEIFNILMNKNTIVTNYCILYEYFIYVEKLKNKSKIHFNIVFWQTSRNLGDTHHCKI